MQEGIYLVDYETAKGKGIAVLNFETLEIQGADISGARWTGSYRYNREVNRLECSVTVAFPEGTFSVVTGSPSKGGVHEETYKFILPCELGAIHEEEFPLLIPDASPVRVRFEKVRDAPNP